MRYNAFSIIAIDAVVSIGMEIVSKLYKMRFDMKQNSRYTEKLKSEGILRVFLTKSENSSTSKSMLMGVDPSKKFEKIKNEFVMRKSTIVPIFVCLNNICMCTQQFF